MIHEDNTEVVCHINQAANTESRVTSTEDGSQQRNHNETQHYTADKRYSSSSDTNAVYADDPVSHVKVTAHLDEGSGNVTLKNHDGGRIKKQFFRDCM